MEWRSLATSTSTSWLRRRGAARADANADLSDANTDANAGYDAGALRERGHDTRSRSRTRADRDAPTAQVLSMAAPPAPRLRPLTAKTVH